MRRLALPISAVLLVAVAAACGPLQNPPGPPPLRYRDPVFSTVTKTSDVTYGTATDLSGTAITLKLDLYQPQGDTATSRPAIVWVHGGSFCCGDKTSPELVDEANTFAREGYVNVSIDYRLEPDGCSASAASPTCLKAIKEAEEDGQTAVRFLRSKALQYRIDPTRIAIGGSSAGAITALNVGYNAANPGPGDHPNFSSAVEAVQSLSGAAILTTPGANGAPALLFHGTADPLVPYAWAQQTVAQAKAAGATAILITWQGGGHVPYGEHRTQILTLTRNFFYSELDLAHAATATRAGSPLVAASS